MSQITPYLRVISGGLDKANLHKGNNVRGVKPHNAGGGEFPALIVSNSMLNSQAQADVMLQSIRQAQAAPGELHSNLNSQRALELLIG